VQFPYFYTNMDWILSHWVELTGTIISFIYLYLEIKENYLMWLVGFLASAFYIIIFFQAKFYADMALQGYYLAISIYGIFYWTKIDENSSQTKPPIVRITGKTLMIVFAVSLILFAVLSQILSRYTDSPLPYWDALTTAFSITATWLLARKIIEHWFFWLGINLLSAILYFYKGLYPTFVLYIIYFVFSYVGYRQWNKQFIVR